MVTRRPLLAITPMVLFVGSVINPTGLETAAGLAFASAGLRIVRDRDGSPAWIWVLLACGGAVTVLAWQLGPVFVAIDLAVLMALLGPQRMRGMLVRSRRLTGTVALALVAALGLYVIWAISSGVAHSTIDINLGGLKLGVGQLHTMFGEAIGVFGWLNVPMQSIFHWVWFLLTAALLASSLLVGSRRERRVVLAVAALVLIVPVVFYSFSYRLSGFPLQGRYMLPLLVLLPLVSGEVTCQATDRIPARASTLLLPAVVATVGIVQLAAWWTNARAAASRQPHTWFMAHATWAPPLGWWPWVGMAIAGSAAIAASGAVSLTVRTHPIALQVSSAPQPERLSEIS